MNIPLHLLLSTKLCKNSALRGLMRHCEKLQTLSYIDELQAGAELKKKCAYCVIYFTELGMILNGLWQERIVTGTQAVGQGCSPTHAPWRDGGQVRTDHSGEAARLN